MVPANAACGRPSLTRGPEIAPGSGMPDGAERPLRAGVLMGLVSGLTAITCCVSPVVLVLVGVATAAEAVSLGDTLYYTYGWYFRAGGLVVGLVAVVVYLRRRRACSIGGAYRYRRTLVVLIASGAVTYAGLFWLTKYLGGWAGDVPVN